MSTFHESLDNLQQQYTKLGNILSAETYRADTAEDSIVELQARVTQLEEEVCNLCEGLYRVGMSANSGSYIPYTNEQTDSISKEITQ